MGPIFILIPWFHPAFKAGGPIQSVANLVTQFKGAALNFKIFCSNKDLDGKALENILPNRWVRYNKNTEVWYSSGNNLQEVLRSAIKEYKPSFIMINGIYSWPYNLRPLLFTHQIKKIISVRGMLHPGALTQKKLKKKFYLLLWKIVGLHKKVTFHATSEEEKIHIQHVFGAITKVIVAANFPNAFTLQPMHNKTAGHLKLISIALISPMKNILLVLEALKIVGSGLPIAIGTAVSIEYTIYGPVKDNGYWQQCLQLIKQMPANIIVTYCGDITPDEIVNALARYHVFILPSKSENFGHAIYEALSAGRPVITSMATPWNDLEIAKAGINISTDNTSALKNAIQFFAAMPLAEWQQWSNGAAVYARQAIDLNKIKQQYQSLFQPDL